MEESHITNVGGRREAGEKIAPTTGTPSPQPRLWRIAGPEIVLDLRGETLQKPRRAF